MNGMLLLLIGLCAVLGALCTLIYTEQVSASRSAKVIQEQLNRIELRNQDLLDAQDRMQNRIDQLSTDVLQREIYQNASDRHQLAIRDAKNGRGLGELMKKHGLSSDEAALILSLHANESGDSASKVISTEAGIADTIDLS